MDRHVAVAELRRLTESLPVPVPFASLASETSRASIVSIKVDDGLMLLHGLMNEPGVAVCHAVADAGTIMPLHKHDEYEYMVVCSGEVELLVSGEATHLIFADSFTIPPGVPHEAFFPIDTELICITIPASADFPEVHDDATSR